jgi:uncharacterized protein (TIGR02453 family)
MATHFSPEALKFLRSLARNNDRNWFQPRKPIFDRDVKAPMLALITEINHAFEGFAPDHIRQPEKTMLRIYRDTRFSNDKSPYKKHIAAWWIRHGLEKTSGAGYYLHLSGKELVIAAGVYMPSPPQLLAIRRHLLEHHAELQRILSGKRLVKLMPDDEATSLTRAPKGFPPDHPGIALIMNKQWGRSVSLPAEMALQPTLLRDVVQRFEAAAPMVELLNQPLIPKPRKPLFGLH